MTWASRKTHVPPDHNDFGSRQFRMWAVSATRPFDAECKTEIDTAIDYDKNDLQVKAAQLLTVEPGRSLLIVTKVHSTGLPITMDPADPKPEALLGVSRVGFSSSGKRALIYHSWSCGSLCGRWWFYVLSRTKDGWVVEGESLQSIS